MAPMPDPSLQVVCSQQRVLGLMQALASAWALRLGLPGLEDKHREREPVPWAPMLDRSLQVVCSEQRVPDLCRP